MAKRTTKVPAKTGYSDSRFNATTHGILSRHTVLDGENPEEYRELHDALIAEHSPQGPTEGHLVEELAGIMWRKQRLRMAEAGGTRFSLDWMLDGSGRSANGQNSGSPKQDYDKEAANEQLLSLIALPPDQAKAQLEEIEDEIDQIGVVRGQIAKHANLNQAVEKLPEPLREDCLFVLEEGDSKSNDELVIELLQTLFERRLKLEYPRSILTQHHEVHEQKQSIVISADGMQKIARYETHLDRKFERTIKLLLQLQKYRLYSDAVNSD